MLEVLNEIKAVDLATGALFLLTAFFLIVSYLPTSIVVRRWSVFMSLLSIVCALRMMMLSHYNSSLTLDNFIPSIRWSYFI